MSQSIHQLSPPFRLIYNKLNEGAVIPFLGAGASLAWRQKGQENEQDHMPSATDLANHLAQEIGFPSDESIELSKVAQYYNLVGGRTPLKGSLHKIFDHNFSLAPLHRFLAGIDKPLLIITTNYDDMIERAFVEQGRPFDLVIQGAEVDAGDRVFWLKYGAQDAVNVPPNKLDIDLQTVTVVYKIHGTVDRNNPKHDQYVITEDDYVEFLARMTRGKAIPAIFAEPFQSHHFLFLGYSLRDWNLRVVLNRIQDSRRGTDLTSWGIQNNPSLLEKKFWEKRGVEVYDMELPSFIEELVAQKGNGA